MTRLTPSLDTSAAILWLAVMRLHAVDIVGTSDIGAACYYANACALKLACSTGGKGGAVVDWSRLTYGVKATLLNRVDMEHTVKVYS